jgi:hypothetical protein
LGCGVSNCVLWQGKALWRIRNDPDLCSFTPTEIKLRLIDYVKNGGKVSQVPEERDEYKYRYRFYYKAIVPIEGFARGVFVEMRLSDCDPDYPVVSLVNADPQSS